MAIDPRRSGPALWTLWVVAGAFGLVVAPLIARAWLGAMVTGSDDPTYYLRLHLYWGAWEAVAAFFQAVLLSFTVLGKRAGLLWLLATFIGAGLLSWPLETLLSTVSSPASFGSLPPRMVAELLFPVPFALALGLAQGLALAWLTRRKLAVLIWPVAALVALLVSNSIGRSLDVAPLITAATGPAVTGAALLLILGFGRRDRPTGPVLAARLPPAPTP